MQKGLLYLLEVGSAIEYMKDNCLLNVERETHAEMYTIFQIVS